MSGIMGPVAPGYSTKELTRDTLQDFERLFETHPAPGAYSFWCMYNHLPSPLPESKKLDSKMKNAARNRRKKRELVESGCSHGILVYAKGEPVGWCQYGPKEELPRIDNIKSYRRLAIESGLNKVWRITCFVVDKKHRKRGITRVALKAALAIRKKGGVTLRPIQLLGGELILKSRNSLDLPEGRIQDSSPPRKE